MARVVFHAGTIRPARKVKIHKRFRVAWCNVCEAHRVLLNPRLWAGWPEGQAPFSGECISCHSTVSVDSRQPPEVA